MDGNGIQVNTVGDANLTAPLPDWSMAHPVQLLLVGGCAICVPSPAFGQESCELIGHSGRSSMHDIFFLPEASLLSLCRAAGRTAVSVTVPAPTTTQVF